MRKFNACTVIKTASFRSLTGVTPDIFREMVCALRDGWDRLLDRKNRSGRPFGVGSLEDHLFVLLIIYRCHITQDFLGLIYGVDKATICRSLQRIEPLVKRVLGVKRAIKVSSEEAQALIIDCTEQPIQRPKRNQKRYYSGKKKRHSMKNEVIITRSQKIVSVSNSAPGTVHDLTVRRRGPPLPKNAHGYADSGYQGYQHEHPHLSIPYKKTKKRKLTPAQKRHNRILSRFRVRVEHTIGRMKIFRILSDRFRYHRSKHAIKFSIIAGITNLINGF